MSILDQVTYSIYLVHLIVIPAVMKLIPHPLAVFPTPGERPVLAVVVQSRAQCIWSSSDRSSSSVYYVLPAEPHLHEVAGQRRIGVD
jgi:hypothetical protein